MVFRKNIFMRHRHLVAATLDNIEFTGRGQEDIENIQYKTTIIDDGPYSISYTTRAEVTLKKNTTSEDITKTLKSVKWKYDIDGFILYKTNEWDAENSLTIVNKADLIKKAIAMHEKPPTHLQYKAPNWYPNNDN